MTVLRAFLTYSIGIMGIGIPQPHTPAQNWIVQAYEQGLIPAPAYSLILGRKQSGSGFTDGSLLVIGGYDADLLEGSIVSFPCDGASHFQIAMDAVIINGQTIKRSDGKPMQAIIDVSCIPQFHQLMLQSGTGGVIVGPSHAVDVFYSLIPGAQTGSQQGTYEFPCGSSYPSVGFQFGGNNFMMNPQDFILTQEGGTCIGALVGQNMPDDLLEEPVWILGNLFMKNFLTIFDLGAPAVGFGQLKSVSSQYGTYTDVPESQRTQLGTGPSATFNPTFQTPQPSGIGVVASEY